MIDRMGVEDLDSVMAIERVSFPEPWPRAVFERELAMDEAVLRVWRMDGRVVGNLVYRVVLDELELHNVAVLPEARGRGIAKALMGALMADARLRECVRVTLEVRERNASARGLYESLGFKVIGRRPGYYPDTGEAAVIYAWEVS